MNYNQYIIQKHRLALALAIVKSKPENVTVDEYIGVVRRNIEMNDENDNDFEMSVKSEDFDINRDDFTDKTECITDEEKELGVNVLPSHLDTDITNTIANIKPASIATTDHESTSINSNEIIIYKILESQVAQSQSEFVKIPKNYLFNINKKENSTPREIVKVIVNDANKNCKEENAYISISDHIDDGENVTREEDLFEFDKDYYGASSMDDFFDTDTVFGQNSQLHMVDINKYVAENTKTEAINFKVVTELNQLKIYLRQTTGKTYSLTNGSTTWLNQWAITLINYIKTCPLLEANETFRLEISHALGEFIDRLYEEKSCPQFFDILLEDVNILIHKIYEEKEEELLEKDNCVTRILLLNQSQHVVKYSIKKICDLLQKFNSEVEKSEILLEIDSIDKIENLAYIFVVLEKLLIVSKENQRLTKSFSQAISSLSQDKDKRLTNQRLTKPVSQAVSSLSQDRDKRLTNQRLTKSVSQAFSSLSQEKDKRLTNQRLTKPVSQAISSLSQEKDKRLTNQRLTKPVSQAVSSLSQDKDKILNNQRLTRFSVSQAISSLSQDKDKIPNNQRLTRFSVSQAISSLSQDKDEKLTNQRLTKSVSQAISSLSQDKDEKLTNQRLTKSVSQAISSLSQDKDKRLTNSEGSLEIFDLRVCGKILNNIISSNIESYGLISFAALQCFNVIQS